MSIIKLLHMITALLSISGFIARAILKLRQSRMLNKKWIKILPHINDTVLLGSAIALAIQHAYSPLQHPWLMAKIIGLLLYICCGIYLMRMAKSPQQIVVALGFSLAFFLYIIFAAVTKSALPGI